MNTSWHSYPKLFAIGHRALQELLLDPVLVEEKVDGSQFSFGLFDDVNGNGKVLLARSKGQQLNMFAPEKMFIQAVETAKRLAADGKLVTGWTYRCEYLKSPKHNSLAYGRIPAGHLALFDINMHEESYVDYDQKAGIAALLGIDVVPRIFEGVIENVEHFREMLNRVSFLGGQKIEGVVVKNYRRFGPDKKVLMGKFVSEHFKEIHMGEWKAANQSSGDVLDRIVRSLTTPARWDKGIQHLRERGALTDSPKDIGPLIKEVQADILAECKDEIVEKLLAYALPYISRGVIKGLPEYYKQKLLERQFDQVLEEDPAKAALICTNLELESLGK